MEEVATMPSNTQEFCLRWNNFHSSLVSALDGFKNDLDFVDVTLACEGQFLKAHKMLLSACSVFFRDLLKANPCQHPIVILPPEVRFIDLEKMLRFIYQGEVNVHQENLARFLKTAEMLKIRGLAEDNEKKVFQASSPRPQDGGNSERGNDNSSVSPKRLRLSIEAQSGSLTDPSQTSVDENSRLSGPDSDSEMIPVKQEMIELKECDFETTDESFLAEAYLREGSSATSSNNTSNTQSSQAHPAAPPPPGPLLPSYVPPPQIKSQDDSPLASNQEELSQGHFARLASDSSGGGEGEQQPGRAPAPNTTASSPRTVVQWSPVGPSNKLWGSSPSGSPASPTPRGLRRSPSQRVSPGGVPTGPHNASSTCSSRSIWHPPASSEDKMSPSGTIPDAPPPPVIQAVSGAVGGAPFTCDICLKTFTSRSNLNKHKRVQHSGEEYICPICSRAFKNRYYIKDHVNLCAAPYKKGGPQNPGHPVVLPPALSTGGDTPPSNHEEPHLLPRAQHHEPCPHLTKGETPFSRKKPDAERR